MKERASVANKKTFTSGYDANTGKVLMYLCCPGDSGHSRLHPLHPSALGRGYEIGIPATMPYTLAFTSDTEKGN